MKDVCNALTLSNPAVVASRIDGNARSKFNLGRQGEAIVINEFGIYQTIFQSRKREAKEFQKWTYKMLKQLRQSAGLEGFQVFLMLDKEHQKEMMEMLKDREPLLDETVELMWVEEKYKLDISVSEKVYQVIDNKKVG